MAHTNPDDMYDVIDAVEPVLRDLRNKPRPNLQITRSTLRQACRFAFGKKTQAKKTQAKSKLKQKTPQKLKEIIAKLKLPEIFPPTLHSIFL